MKRMLLIVAVLSLPCAAFANATRDIVTTSKISPRAAARYVYLSTPAVSTTASGAVARVVYPYAAGARLVDVVIFQVSAGTGGTSWTLDAQNPAGTSLFSTLPVQTQASGNSKVADTRGDLALPSGWTRGVIKTDGTEIVTKGALLNLVVVTTGTYSPQASFVAVLVFEPRE